MSTILFDITLVIISAIMLIFHLFNLGNSQNKRLTIFINCVAAIIMLICILER